MGPAKHETQNAACSSTDVVILTASVHVLHMYLNMHPSEHSHVGLYASVSPCYLEEGETIRLLTNTHANLVQMLKDFS